MSEAVEESGSLADHEAQFGPPESRAQAAEVETNGVRAEDSNGSVDGSAEGATAGTEDEAQKSEREEKARNDKGQFTKHRAKSQQASPEDVPRIKELTRKLREAEEALAASRRQPAEREPSRPEPTARQSAQPSTDFTDKEPTIDQFANEADPYAAWIRAVNRYDRKKEAFEADQARVQSERQRVEADGQAYVNDLRAKYAQKAEAFAAEHSDFGDLLAEYGDWDIPGLANAVILEHENGPQLVYNLLKQPEELAGLILLTDGKPVNEKTVALATRWLEKRALDVKTGSSAPVVQRKPTPTPPNPVRTVPSGSADSDDIESMSLSSFEQKFSKRRR